MLCPCQAGYQTHYIPEKGQGFRKASEAPYDQLKHWDLIRIPHLAGIQLLSYIYFILLQVSASQ